MSEDIKGYEEISEDSLVTVKAWFTVRNQA